MISGVWFKATIARVLRRQRATVAQVADSHPFMVERAVALVADSTAHTGDATHGLLSPKCREDG